MSATMQASRRVTSTSVRQASYRGVRAVNAVDRELLAIATRIGHHLLGRRQTVTVAESCTGGWIAKTITDVAGSSQWFDGGFVTYSNEAKLRTLGVGRSTLKRRGAVSEAVVRAMAAGALERTAATVAIAVTGIAGPGGGLPGKPVGTVWFCWAERRGARVRFRVECKRFLGDRDTVRRKTVRWALARIIRH
jgi:nicotinamide-nucleotide amidase